MYGDIFERLRESAKSPQSAARPKTHEVYACEVCSRPIGGEHRHLFEMSTRNLLCVCGPCVQQYHHSVDQAFKVVPRNPREIDGPLFSDEEWEQLALPINLAFFVRRSDGGEIAALYPSPGGVTESLLPMASWAEIEAENEAVSGLQRDIEALLVNRLTTLNEAYIVPIDLCYELTGLIRLNWKGLSGGEAVRREIGDFFDRLREAAVGDRDRRSDANRSATASASVRKQ